MASISIKQELEADTSTNSDELHEIKHREINPLSALDDNLELRRQEMHDIFANFHKMIDMKLKLLLEELSHTYKKQKEDIQVKISQKDQLEKSKIHLRHANIESLEPTLMQINKEIENIEESIFQMREIKISWNIDSFATALTNILVIEAEKPLNSSKHAYIPKPASSTASTVSTPPLANYSYSHSGDDTKTIRNITQGQGEDQISTPNDMVVDKVTGNIFVADRANHRVQVFDFSGAHLYEMIDRDLRSPNRLCITDRYLYVTCIMEPQRKANKCISSHVMKFDKTDQEAVSILKLEDKLIRICSFDSGILCTDYMSHYVRHYDSAFRLLTANKLSSPYFTNSTKVYDIILMDKELYVLSQGSMYPIQVFNPSCTIIRCITLSSPLVGAYYFCLDKGKSTIVISDTEGNMVKVFNRLGECICVIGEGGDIPCTLTSPRGVDIDSNGNIIVCDTRESFIIQSF
ncbi:hypothetical protein LOD99_13667 [Oopsacas minuta]|uniref:Uncharacterized protein n=1 Tax=Oopsacas minuta TaxID=111878 RepID=A0AAV7KIG2_9METZ|nr:hypothetical protein LOD99_13667 [Oopsacas minuta]